MRCHIVIEMCACVRPFHALPKETHINPFATYIMKHLHLSVNHIIALTHQPAVELPSYKELETLRTQSYLTPLTPVTHQSSTLGWHRWDKRSVVRHGMAQFSLAKHKYKYSNVMICGSRAGSFFSPSYTRRFQVLPS